jgi:N6-L-threonylcarbamoyladenine synthase
MKILGIESSCDETSIAIIEDGRILTNAIYTQSEHGLYGGVVPEIASRAHLEKIDKLTTAAFIDTNTTPETLDLIAVTDSPGLAGALLVGVSFALGLHTAWKIPITGINHLEGHIFSVMLEHPQVQFPFLALVVSGGHTAIYKVKEIGDYELIGQTVDDAAGEAFDKVGKMLGFSYPAGKAIEQAAESAGDSRDIIFPVARVSDTLNFSFSGLKTAVKYFLSKKDNDFIESNKRLICKAFQNSVIESLVGHTRLASKKTGITTIALVGGVACNGKLRKELKKRFGDHVFFPSPHLCTDNAAMIALAGLKRWEKNMTRFPHMDPSCGL